MSTEPTVPVKNEETVREMPLVSPAVTPERELPAQSVVSEEQLELNPKLRDTAETVGATVGRAVCKVREFPQRMSEMKQRFTVIRGRTREDAASAAGELKETARQKVHEARSLARYHARENPIQFILAVGAVSFVLGFSLRIWRSSRRG
jgi:hypothetical protein